jgi:translocation and assembly module TamA
VLQGGQGIFGLVVLNGRGILASLLVGALGTVPLPAGALDAFSFLVPAADETLTARLRGASVLAPLADQGVDDAQELLAAARAEYSRLLGALYNEGHYGGVITISVDGREAAAIPPLETPARISSIVVEIRPGPRYTFSRATVDPVAPGSDIPEGYAAGEPARTSAIRATAVAAVTGWQRLGYAKAEVSDQSIVADHRSDTVASDLRLAPGQQLRYGDIIVRGANRVREDRIVFMSGLRRADQVFDPDELEDAARRIRRSGAFRSVSVIEADEPNADGTLDIILQVAEERRRRYGIGFEFSTVEGPGIDAFWLHRNLFGGAERLRVEAEWTSIGGDFTGGEDYTINARFTRTSSFGPDTDFYIFTELEQLNEPTFNSSSASLEVGYTRMVGENLSVAAAIGYRFSSIRENGTTNEFYMLTLPLQATYDTRDDILNARSGFYIDTDVTPFVGFSGTDDGLHFYGDGRAYQSFGEILPVTLAGRVQFGSIMGARLDRVPNYMRFFSGGGGTVRGQDYESLGVTLDGDKSGGASLLVLSAEARATVTDSIGVVAFADFGVVGRDPFPEDLDNNHYGAGLGLRYLTPVGPLRVDVAFPVDGAADADDYYLYIGIGQAF